jgi:hypothetical protein
VRARQIEEVLLASVWIEAWSDFFVTPNEARPDRLHDVSLRERAAREFVADSVAENHVQKVGPRKQGIGPALLQKGAQFRKLRQDLLHLVSRKGLNGNLLWHCSDLRADYLDRPRRTLPTTYHEDGPSDRRRQHQPQYARPIFEDRLAAIDHQERSDRRYGVGEDAVQRRADQVKKFGRGSEFTQIQVQADATSLSVGVEELPAERRLPDTGFADDDHWPDSYGLAEPLHHPRAVEFQGAGERVINRLLGNSAETLQALPRWA